MTHDRRPFWKSATIQQKIDRLRIAYEDKVVRQEGCWDWKGWMTGQGYGGIYFDSKTIGAYKASWIINNGMVPDGKWILHKCDNRICSNPDHLYLGTSSQNAIDRINRTALPKNMFTCGENHPSAKLKTADVIRIKELIALGVPSTRLAKEYKVNDQTISKIKHKQSWKHLT